MAIFLKIINSAALYVQLIVKLDNLHKVLIVSIIYFLIVFWKKL